MPTWRLSERGPGFLTEISVWLVGMAMVVAAAIFLLHLGTSTATAAETGPCAVPVTNKIACENSKPGDPPANWQIQGIGDESIQGFATQISTNVGGTVNFKIKTPAASYHINILRLGYYGGDGARIIASNIQPSAKLPQVQPECMHEEATGLIDCGNWGVSASWEVPKEAVSGLYVAQLVRNDTGGESQIFFVVKEEESHAPIVLKTSDATWEAYNAYGGNSLYSCTKWCPKGEPEAYKAAYAVSYNRPFDGTLQTDAGQSDPFYAEYQLIRFMEKNGYNMTYVAQPDIQSNPALLENHKVFISSGHDEYWSAGERSAVESAREAGVNLAFFSGNEVFWKTRWGSSIDGSNAADRTLITYKETHFNAPVDPDEPAVSTSSWRDPRFGAQGGAGKPENSLTGQYFTVNSGSADIKVPGTFAKLRFWRNTAVSKLSPSETLTLSPGTGTLGYEWDSDADNGFRPPGRISMSSTTVNDVEIFTDYGTTTKPESIATHSLSLYRAPSGALVFGSGTVDWSWGLDNTNAWGSYLTDPSGNPPDPTMQQATVNLMADMGAQPATLQSNLVAATESTDKTPPIATITSPTAGKAFKNGEAVTVSGTAADAGGGVVAAVEVSTDGGKTWHPATGTSSWTYSWNIDGETSATLEVRAVDDSGNIGAASAGTTVSISCPCSMFGSMTPATADSGDRSSIELGVKFRSDVAGTISGIRYFKSTANTGTHIGSLWTASGTLLGQATFSGESASGWQQVQFASPVAIQANTTYVAGYLAPVGHYSDSAWQFDEPPATGSSMLNHAPLHILPDTEGGNGVYKYSGESTFPDQSYQADNYWVDVLFNPTTPPLPPGQPTGVAATAGSGQATITWTAPGTGGAPASYRITPYIGGAAQTAITVPAAETTKVLTGLTAGTTYTFVVTAVNEGGAGPDSSHSNPVTPTTITAPTAPTAVSATAGLGSATVSWTAPASNGGSAITAYKITPYLEGKAQTPVSAAAGATSTTVTGLTAGSSYTFTVIATNAIGSSPESAPSNAVTPSAASSPGAPTALSASAKSSGAVLSWTAPASNGGSAITAYRITPYVGATAQTATTTSSAATSVTVGNLTDGTAYTFKVAAINAIGTGAESTASAPVTPYDTIFDLATPGTVDAGDSGSVELGVKFRSDVGGTINGIRFYKAAANTGTHIGSLWTASGTLLGQATFSGESASGWQQVQFASPVAIQANTTYVAGYLAPAGHYSVNGPTLTSAVDNPPLHAEAAGTSGNGVYAYGSGVTFPSSSFQGSNYWVDVLFTPEAAPTAPTAPTAVSATAGLGSATVSWTAPASGSAPTSYTVTPYVGNVAQTSKTVTGSPPATSTTISGLTAGTSYTFTVKAANAGGSSPESAPSNAVTPNAASVPGAPSAPTASARNLGAVVSWTAPANEGGSAITAYRIIPFVGSQEQAATTVGATTTSTTIGSLANGTSYTFKVVASNGVGTGSASEASAVVVPRATLFEQAVPATPDESDSNSVVLGVKFSSSIPGKVRGIRFYKSAANTGTHKVGLWTSTGTLLSQATVTGETASGWQEANFATPVSIAANTIYVAAYLAPKGHYAATGNGFANAVSSSPLTAPANSTTPNGLYVYSSSLIFPTSTYNATNYWVDVLFSP
jgi:hypothetical protein